MEVRDDIHTDGDFRARLSPESSLRPSAGRAESHLSSPESWHLEHNSP